ncbi:kinase-like domain-containing protein, partial [Coprinopsis sp. MPI-PUGE-AT-0042]
MTPGATTVMSSAERTQGTPRTSNRVFDFLVTPPSMTSSIHTESSRVTDTPIAESTQAAAAGQKDAKRQREMVLHELARHTVEAEATWATTLYARNVTEAAAQRYLDQTSFYKDGSWQVPKAPSSERALYIAFAKVIKDIMKHFGFGANHGRQVYIDTLMDHLEDEPTEQRSRPDITIIADDPCIRGSGLPDKPTYQSAIACWDIKLDESMGNISEQKGQMGVYARQLFSQQPNRMFVRSLVISEKRLRLFQFDRSGLQYSKLINIHEDPITFIRLVVCLTSGEPTLVGFDPDYKWFASPSLDGSIEGEVTVYNDDGSDPRSTVCELLGSGPLFSRRSVRGRGTTCWKVKDKSGKVWLVKEAWVALDRTRESTFLQLAKEYDVPGVARMVSFQILEETSHFRGEGASLPGFENRVKVRMVMECYGEPIYKFSNSKQLLYALTAAVNGLRKLYQRGILHRDISVNNILLGDPEGDLKWRGVMIDLDMAANFLVEGNVQGFRSGTRTFQSTNVLASYNPRSKNYTPHDYGDDLESFLYVYVYLLCCYDSCGERRSELVYDNLLHWKSDDAMVSLNSKATFFADA